MDSTATYDNSAGGGGLHRLECFFVKQRDPAANLRSTKTCSVGDEAHNKDVACGDAGTEWLPCPRLSI